MKWFTSTAATISKHLGRDTPLVKGLRPVYNRMLDSLYAESGVEVQVGEQVIKVCHTARNFAQIEPDVYAYLHANIAAGDTILDVGSYLGIYAILSARKAGPQGRVIAFEPTTTSLPLLHRHLVMNGMHRSVRVLACALGQHSGVAEFYEHTDAYLNSVGTKDPTASDGAAVWVPMLSIDEACAMFTLQPDLIRIDVQGLEAQVLQGAKQTIKRLPKLKLIIEVHPQLWALQGMDQTKFEAILQDLGLHASTPDGGRAEYFPDAHLVLRARASQASP